MIFFGFYLNGNDQMTPDKDMIDNLINELKEIISNQMDVNIHFDEIDPDTSLFEDGLGLDSIAIVEFITLIEERTGFRFKEGGLDMDNFKNLRTLALCIAQGNEPLVQATEAA